MKSVPLLYGIAILYHTIPSVLPWHRLLRTMLRPESESSLVGTAPTHALERQAGGLVWGSGSTGRRLTLLRLVHGPPGRGGGVARRSAVADRAVEGGRVVGWDGAGWSTRGRGDGSDG